MTPEQTLMERIHSIYGEPIAAAVKGTPFSPALLAALVANESSGLAEAGSRFEPGVFWQLAFVLIGRKPDFGAIKKPGLDKYLGASGATAAVYALVNLASSWGPTQIMGYQAIARGYTLTELTADVEKHFQHAVELLADFSKEFRLPADGAQAPFFHCWNTGRPDMPTADARYVPNGLARMQLYETVAEQHA